MRKSLLPEKYHTYIYIFALIMLVVGMPLSKFLMSLSQIILACNWLLEGGLKAKWSAFIKNKPALIISSLLLLHLIGLTYTSDFEYALKDIKIKAPLLVLPLILSTSKPFARQTYHMILQFFVAAIIVGTIISVLILTGVIFRQIVDVRSVSIFISHIRFALLIDIAIFIACYFSFNAEKSSFKLLWILIAVWLIYFLILTESITGLAALSFAGFIVISYLIIKSSKKLIKAGGLLMIIFIMGFGFYVVNQLMDAGPEKEVIDFSKLETTTAHGNMYSHDTKSRLTENGHYIWVYICEKELAESWNKRSMHKFAEEDLKGNNISYTIVRFLASKGLRKDADAVNALTNEEIKAIERGVVNVNYQDLSSLDGRLHEIQWELDLYKTTGDPNGHSITMRFEFWKAALGIIKDNLLIGVGTGDIKQAFEKQYEKMNSPLLPEWRLRSHNQYLSVTVAFGILGLTWFLLTIFYPMILNKKTVDYLYVSFLLVATISFLTEDTLETQAGVTFYAFFNSFFLFIPKKED